MYAKIVLKANYFSVDSFVEFKESADVLLSLVKLFELREKHKRNSIGIDTFDFMDMLIKHTIHNSIFDCVYALDS